MRITSAAITHQGKIRGNNEDNFFMNGSYKEDTNLGELICIDDAEHEHYIYAVCDGVGGCNAGEIASAIAVKAIGTFFKNGGDNLKACAFAANDAVVHEASKLSFYDMGTTFVGLLIEPPGFLSSTKITVCNVGDSRAYSFRDGALRRVSKDHSRVQMMLDAGIITEEEAINGKLGHSITQCLGRDRDDYTISPFYDVLVKPQEGDIFLLCSDGLTDMVKEPELQEYISQNQNKGAEELACELRDKALENGGRDNITIIVIKIS